MINFKDWLKTKEITEFYEIELKEIERKIDKAYISPEFLEMAYGIIPLKEAIILPEKIKMKTKNIDELNSEFKNQNIIFHYATNELSGYYDKQKDEVHIFFDDKKVDNNSIEAMVAHELVHKEQHKRAGENYFKQSEIMIKKINALGKEISSLYMTNPKSPSIAWNKNKERLALLDEFKYLSPYESMAYACQFVKNYKDSSPKEIFKHLEDDKIPLNNITKKYIAMYWLIRDKI